MSLALNNWVQDINILSNSQYGRVKNSFSESNSAAIITNNAK